MICLEEWPYIRKASGCRVKLEGAKNLSASRRHLYSPVMIPFAAFWLWTALSFTSAATSGPYTSVLRNLRSPRPSTAAASPQREKTCLVDSHSDLTTDDSKHVLSAFQECNNGGRKRMLRNVLAFATELIHSRRNLSPAYRIHPWRTG